MPFLGHYPVAITEANTSFGNIEHTCLNLSRCTHTMVSALRPSSIEPYTRPKRGSTYEIVYDYRDSGVYCHAHCS
jgi:hypothetical protein